MYDNIVFSEFTYAHDQQDKSSSWFSKKSSQVKGQLLDDIQPFSRADSFFIVAQHHLTARPLSQTRAIDAYHQHI
jgi:hypothetical protein